MLIDSGFRGGSDIAAVLAILDAGLLALAHRQSAATTSLNVFR